MNAQIDNWNDLRLSLAVARAGLSGAAREIGVSHSTVFRRIGGAAAPLAERPWIGFDAEHAPLVRELDAFLPGVRPGFRVNSVAAAVAAARTGIGLATLPCGIADLEPGLLRVADLPEGFTLDLWLLTHEDLRRSARIRAFLDFMAEALAREAPLLEGGMPRAGRASMVMT